MQIHKMTDVICHIRHDVNQTRHTHTIFFLLSFIHAAEIKSETEKQRWFLRKVFFSTHTHTLNWQFRLNAWHACYHISPNVSDFKQYDGYEMKTCLILWKSQRSNTCDSLAQQQQQQQKTHHQIMDNLKWYYKRMAILSIYFSFVGILPTIIITIRILLPVNFRTCNKWDIRACVYAANWRVLMLKVYPTEFPNKIESEIQRKWKYVKNGNNVI